MNKLAELNEKITGINPGDIFVCSWGYEQSNISFYQIIDVKGNNVVLIELAQNKQYHHYDTGLTTPVKDTFIGDLIELTIDDNGLMLNFYRPLSPWEGKPRCWSSYH